AGRRATAGDDGRGGARGGTGALPPAGGGPAHAGGLPRDRDRRPCLKWPTRGICSAWNHGDHRIGYRSGGPMRRPGPPAGSESMSTITAGRPLVAGAAEEASALRTSVIRSWPEIAALGDEWNGLLSRSRGNAIFLTREWIQCWLDVGGRQMQPFYVVVREPGGRLVGVAPFYVCRYDFCKALPMRILRIAADYPTGADYGDWLVSADREECVCRAIGKALARHAGAWDAVWMPNVAGWTGALDRVRLAADAAGLRMRQRRIGFAAMPLGASLAAFDERLSGHRRRELRRQRKHLQGQASDLAMNPIGADESLDAWLDVLFSLHHERWMTRGDAGAFDRKPVEADFYRRFAPLARERGWLRLYALRAEGKVRAMQVGYRYGDAFLALQDGFDPDYVAGVGNALRYHVIEASIAEGVRDYDFLGVMSEHKRRWGAEARDGADVFVPGRSLRGLLLRASRLWPTGRYLQRHPDPLHSGEAALATADSPGSET
ncbi:MAG: GNAT family N-acetyltransferase, partial [Rubrivivax sp.]